MIRSQDKFFKDLPKIELHAHLNGSLSFSTMVQLQRFIAGAEAADKFKDFLNTAYFNPSISKDLANIFPLFEIAQNLTSNMKTLAMATELTLQEYEEDGCCFVELRSTPRDTPKMSKKDYIETIIQTLRKYNSSSAMISCLLISINRSKPLYEAESITDLAIEFHKLYPDIVVGIDLSGDPAIGVFKDFVPALTRVREAGLKITLHCGEICNPDEIIEMLKFKPDRIGHAVCIHPKYGGTDDTWKMLCESDIPVEICLTSNVVTKSVPNYTEHHFVEFNDANIPMILCTDDKGIFETTLSNEYNLCNKKLKVEKSQLALLALKSSDYIFLPEKRRIISNIVQNYMNKIKLS